MTHIILGQEVKDRVSGFTGIAVSRHQYLNGCDRLSVQPMMNDKGELPEIKTFDEPDLIVLSLGVSEDIEKPAKKTGGPHGHDLELR